MGGALRSWGLWACLALGLGLAAWASTAPAPVPAGAPADAFSAERAMADVRLVGGAGPHPTGSAAAARVRGALLARMDALGLHPRVREGVGVSAPRWSPGRIAAGTVENLLGVLPGRDPAAPAVLLMAHTDSTPNSPGAADDGAGVATALEVVRALRATGPHRRDVLVLLTDGEEEGLLGAESFFGSDPARAHVGAVINLEARGDAGRAAMFETGVGDGDTVRLFARSARAPFANSLTAFLYHLLPNDTDFTWARRAGLPGLNIAFAGDQLAYHTPLATPGHLSRASLQGMGDEALGPARALADAPALPARSPDLAYSDVFGRFVVAYPPAAGWLVWAAGAALLALAWAGAARAQGEAAKGASAGGAARGAARGAATALAAALGAALVLHVAGRLAAGPGYTAVYHLLRAYGLLFAGAGLLALGAALGAYAAAAQGRPGPLLAGAALAAGLSLLKGPDAASWALAGATALLGWAGARRPLSPWGAWLGALALLAALAMALQAAAPLAAPWLEWPLVLAGGPAAACAWARGRGARAAWALPGAAAVLSLAWLGSLAEGLFTLSGPTTPEVLAAPALLLTAALAPFALLAFAGGRRGGRAWAIPAATLGIGACAVAAAALGAAGPDRPELADAFHLLPEDGPALRVSPRARLAAWDREALGPARRRRALPPFLPYPVWTAPAPPSARPVPRPGLDVSRTGAAAAVVARAANGGRRLLVFVRASGPISGLGVNGRATDLHVPAGVWAQVDYAAPPASGVRLQLALPAGARLELRAYEQADGWPPGAAPPPKPPGVMAWGDSDTTLAAAAAASASSR